MSKYLFTSLLALFHLIGTHCFSQLFRVIENSKVGYINIKGEIVIEPKYHQGGEFCEGLAPVRENGLLGYIDENENYIIKPEFEYATNFKNGYAVVFSNGKSSVIDKKGSIIISGYFDFYIQYPNTINLRTRSGHFGMFNPIEKKFTLDTIYQMVSYFNNGICVVRREIENDKLESAIFDSLGECIIPFGRFDNISYFIDGFASVAKNISDKECMWIEMVINKHGDIISDTIEYNTCKFYSDEGFFKKWSRNYFFDRLNDGVYIMKDRNGKVLNSDTFSGYSESYWSQNIIVRKPGMEGLVSPNGRYVMLPQKYRLNEELLDWNLIGFHSLNANSSNENSGLLNTSGNILIDTIIDYFDIPAQLNSLLKARINGSWNYIDTSGNIVWNGNLRNDSNLRRLNIDFIRPSTYRCTSKLSVDEAKRNFNSRKNSITQGDFPPNELSIKVFSQVPDTFDKIYNGYSFYLANRTGDKIDLGHILGDARVFLQVKDSLGKWRDVETLVEGLCGLAYSTSIINSDSYWKFVAPAYEGEITSSCRLRLEYINENENSWSQIYSNEFVGSYNPAQLWKKGNYYSIENLTSYLNDF